MQTVITKNAVILTEGDILAEDVTVTIDSSDNTYSLTYVDQNNVFTKTIKSLRDMIFQYDRDDNINSILPNTDEYMVLWES
jgi:hypothetical protein